MFGNKACGRPLHDAASGEEKHPRCLMHSRDTNKSNESFHEEFERVLHDAGEGWADFTGFVLLWILKTPRRQRLTVTSRRRTNS
jgi:hypothetical protein